eukprot:CAMPEP_0114342096 /NCGR_PEP_ID=MMETSP0101-20121206/9538_1 /TAXON_ID=38822 ORGANISM="Pteridomonas danica, Strain PT" /NCGR_SAMPLE_ID=MMETSP0101 /ASSEMBLY_ACC=CAM_ASM_000211 /LENGTH=139 /DNA_ID=CAMNT_0001476023 /DNA_START=213 /DNA_END=632 /DNA_ORIENTATION=+
MVQRNIDDIWFPARILSESKKNPSTTSIRNYDVQYLDDGKTEIGVPQDELRLTSEVDRQHNIAPAALSLPLEGLLDICGTNGSSPEIVRTPRAIIHDQEGNVKDAERDSNVFIIEGQQEKLAVGGGMRGIQFLRHSTRA